MEGDCRSSSSELSDSSESVKSATASTTTTANGTPLKKPVPKSRSASNSPKHAHKE